MKSIAFLKAAYTIAWLVYLGYLGRILLRMRRVEEEIKEVSVDTSSTKVAPGVQRQRA
ncbi:MAG TPA: hypothetical protein VGG15_03545 [Terriglobales bacterium]|jgi:hypothetical protein